MATLSKLQPARRLDEPDRDSTGAIKYQIKHLLTLDLQGLRLQWRNTFGKTAPNHLPRHLLARILAYRLQADVYGDLPCNVRRVLEGVNARRADGGGPDGGNALAGRSGFPKRIKPGSLLVREWGGHLHRVMVLEEGFAWEGKTYRSLSQAARAITGAHWNGPRFFGLTGSKATVSATAKGAALVDETKS